MRFAPAFTMLAIMVAVPAIAGQSGAVDLWSAPTAMPPADSGKPAIISPPAVTAPPASDACLPGTACGMRLLGTVRKNGAVELQVPALRW